MNTCKIKKFFLKASITVVALITAPGCWNNKKEGTETPSNTENTKSDAGQVSGGKEQPQSMEIMLATGPTVLVTLNDKPFITKEGLIAKADSTNPQISQIIHANPSAMPMLCQMEEAMQVGKRVAKAEGWTETPEYKNYIDEKAAEFFMQKLAEKAATLIDTSEATIKALYEKAKTDPELKNHIIASEGGLKAEAVEFKNEADAKAFLDKAKANKDLKAAAEAQKLEVKDLGVVNEKTYRMANVYVGPEPKKQILALKPNDFAVVKIGNDQYWVVKGVELKKDEFKSFEEASERLINVKKQNEMMDAFNKLIAKEMEKYGMKETEALAKLKDDLNKKQHEEEESDHNIKQHMNADEK